MSSTDTETSAPSGSGSGYGQQDPNDGSHDFNKIAFLTSQILGRISTMKPVTVKAVHLAGDASGAVAKAGTVDVQPLVNQIDGQGNATPHGTVYGVPIFRVGGGASALIADPAAGDVGFVVCADRDISSVVKTGKRSNPGSRRRFDLADGVYLGGILAAAPTRWLRFFENGFEIADEAGNKISATADGMVLTPASGKDAEVAGPLHVTGKATLDGAAAVGGDATVGGSLQIAGTSAIKRVLTATTTFGGTVPVTGAISKTIAVTGAKVGDSVVVTCRDNGTPFMTFRAIVSAPDAVVLTINNPLGTSTWTTSTFDFLVIGFT